MAVPCLAFRKRQRKTIQLRRNDTTNSRFCACLSVYPKYLPYKQNLSVSFCYGQGRIQTVATVARAPVRFSSSDFKPKSKFTKKCFYLRFPSLKMDIFFFSVSIKFFELIKDSDLMFSFSVRLLLYMLLNLYILILSELFRYAMITQPKIAQPVATLLAQQYL